MVAAPLLGGCVDNESAYGDYTDWYNVNDNWLTEMTARTNDDGTPYYERITAPWDANAYVLIHYFNDRRETVGNLSPLYTSTVDCRYQLHSCTDVRVDSSLSNTRYGDGIARFRIDQTITGWAIAFSDIRVGDTCEVIVPYQQGYGATATTTLPPYSNLRFNIRLVDIPYYEIRN